LDTSTPVEDQRHGRADLIALEGDPDIGHVEVASIPGFGISGKARLVSKSGEQIVAMMADQDCLRQIRHALLCHGLPATAADLSHDNRG
jgi:hypothetical protein